MSSPSRGPGTPGAPRERKVPHECWTCVAPPPQPPWAELGRERPQERGLAFEQSPLGAGPDSVLTATPPDVTGAARRRVRDCSPAPSREGKAAGPPSRPAWHGSWQRPVRGLPPGDVPITLWPAERPRSSPPRPPRDASWRWPCLQPPSRPCGDCDRSLADTRNPITCH